MGGLILSSGMRGAAARRVGAPEVKIVGHRSLQRHSHKKEPSTNPRVSLGGRMVEMGSIGKRSGLF